MMKYLKVWTSFRQVIARLTDTEKGRLFDAMLAYAESGEEPENLTGNDSIIWPAAKQSIDLTAERNAKLRENGSKGGTAKSLNRQALAIDSKGYQNVANVSKDNQTLAEKKRNEMKENEKESNPFLDDDEAKAIQGDHDRLLNAAEDAGFKMSNSVRASLIRLYSENGIEKVLAGLDECMRHGAANLAYLEAVLKGTGKRKPAVKVLPAQQYEQRDYSEVQAELMAEQDREMQEYMKRQIG